ncbi:MAG: Vps62-related protein, partial [Novosphingobium sp.]|nr:Vps62-related protein [Novosphingobium sp.]
MKKMLFLLLSITSFVNAISKQEKESIAQKGAPMLYIHPDDVSSLTSVDWYIPKCSLELLDDKTNKKRVLIEYGKLTPEELGKYDKNKLKSLTSNPDDQFFLNAGGPKREDVLKGPGYQNGFSDQHAYYNVVELSDNEIKISYWFFYANQGAIKIMPGLDQILESFDVGNHEGDWEHIDERWKKENNGQWQLVEVFYARHGQAKGDTVKKADLELVNDSGVKDKNGTHPVVYVAVNSHASYPKNLTFISTDVDKTSNQGPRAKLWGTDSNGQLKLEDYSDKPWKNYVGRWGADVKKHLGGSPEGPEMGGSFIKSPKRRAELIVDGKPYWQDIEVKNGKSKEFKIDPRARIKQIDFKVSGTKPEKPVKFSIFRKGDMLKGLFGDKQLYGPFSTN